jgi:regulatory protein
MRKTSMRRAGHALARRARSEAELARCLASVAPPDVVEGVLDDLRGRGYLDDAALALAITERRLEAGWGPLRVRADLARLEIRDEAARGAIDAAEAGELEAARRLLALRAKGLDLRRRAALLARRGFGEDVASALLGLDPD